MLMVIALGVHALARRAHREGAARRVRVAHTVAMLAIEAAFALMLVETLSVALHPQYTWWAAAQDMAARMRADAAPGQTPKLLAGSADDVALFTGCAGVNPEWPDWRPAGAGRAGAAGMVRRLPAVGCEAHCGHAADRADGGSGAVRD